MKKLLSTILSLIFTISAFSQGEYNYVQLWKFNRNSHMSVRPTAVANTTVKFETTNLKNGKKRIWKETFDDNGMLIKSVKINDGEEQIAYSNVFDENKKLVNSKKYKKSGEVHYEAQIERNTDGKYREVRQLKNGKLKNKQTFNFNSGGCLESSKYYKSNDKLKNIWQYEYYTDCDKKRTILLNGNGKVKQQWTYDCKKEGEQLTKKNDVTQICKWEESDDEHIIKIYQSFDEKGKVYKTVSKYRSSDTAIVSTKKYNGDDELVYENTYQFDRTKPLTYTYYRNGKEKWGYKYTYDQDKQTSYTSYKNGEQRSKSVYEYQPNGLLLATKYFRKDGELYSTTSYKYNSN